VNTAATIARNTVRIAGLIQIVLGLLLWTGRALNLLSVHIAVGLILVLALWTLAGLGARAGVNLGFVLTAFLWGLVVVLFGLTQTQILTGGSHWLIQILHLAIGLSAIGQAEGLGQRIKQTWAPARA
jgi:hypothetical protein